MQISNTALLALLALAAAAPIDTEPKNKRAIQYVTQVDTVQIGLAQYTALHPALAAAAPVAAAAAPSPVAPAPAAPAAAAVTTAPAAAALTGSGSLFSKLIGDLGRYFGKSSAAAAPTAAAPAASSPAAPAAAAPATSSIHYAPAAPTGGANGYGYIPQPSISIPQVSSLNLPQPSGSSIGAAPANGDSLAEYYSLQSKGIAYSPYRKQGGCKSASEVAADIKLLLSYDIIRLYATDCSGIPNVLAAMGPSQQLFLGVVNIDQGLILGDLGTISSAVQATSRGWSAVHTIAIGNELVNSGQQTPSAIISAVNYARSWLQSNASGYKGYVVSVDTLVAVLGNPSLCDASDYLAVNSHPFWDGGVQPGNSGPWLQQQIQALQSKCNNGKQILITETGWPTEGQSFQSCVPSVSNQVAAIKSIVQLLASQVLMFTTYNDYWKDPGPYGVEQHWGIYGDPSA